MAVVHVPQNDAAPVIRELLAAAEKLGLPAAVVKTTSDGVFGFSLIVPDEVLELTSQNQVDARGDDPEPEPQAKPKNKGGRPKKAAASDPEPEE